MLLLKLRIAAVCLGLLFCGLVFLGNSPEGLSQEKITYSQIPQRTWILVDEGTFAERDAGLQPPVNILAYSGMAIDTIRKQILVAGGGHNDYWGNEVWAWSIATQNWIKLYNSDTRPSTLQECQASVDNLNRPGMWVPSNRPISRHLYESMQFITHLGKVFLAGGSTYAGPPGLPLRDNTTDPTIVRSDLCYPTNPQDMWMFDPSSLEWTYIRQPGQDTVVYVAYHADARLLISWAGKKTQSIDVDTGIIADLSPRTSPSNCMESAMTYDSKRKLIYRFGGNYPSNNELWAYDYSANTWNLIQPNGAKPPPGGGWGMAYDEASDVIVIFGIDGLWVYDPSINQWTKNPASSLSQPVGGSGVFGHLKYDPSTKLTFYVEPTSDLRVNVWAYRHTPDSSINDPAPYISNVKVSNITTDSATVSYTTDVESDTQIEYGLNTSYGSLSHLDSRLVTNHIQTLTALVPGTDYHFSVKSKTALGAIAISPDNNFKTSPVVITPNTQFPIHLIVEEALPSGVSGLSRSNEPVTIGVPLAEDSGINNVDQLGLSGVTAGQFRPLARWPNGNLKWVLIDFQTSVTAGNSNESVALTSGHGNFGGPPLATNTANGVMVDTGVARFSLRSVGFNMFDTVIVGSRTFVRSGSDSGILAVDDKGISYSSAADSNSRLAIEENGSVKATIRSDGSLISQAGKRLLDYTARLEFFRGKSTVKAKLTLRNASRTATHPLLFRSIQITQQTTIAGTPIVEFATRQDSVVRQLAGNSKAYLYQGYSSDRLLSETRTCSEWRPPVPGTCSNGIYSFDVTNAGLAIAFGSHILANTGNADDWTRGWAELRDGSGQGITIAHRWMSAYWPTGFEFSADGATTVELFSKHNPSVPLKFSFAAHETRELLFDFHTNPANNENLLYMLQFPLIARAELAHYMSTRAFYGQDEFVTPEQQAAWFQKNGKTSPSLANPESPKIYRYWPWSEGGGNNQTDFPLNDLIDYLRTGQPGFYLRGQQRTLFNADSAVVHSDDYGPFEAPALQQDPAPNQLSVNGRHYDMEHAHILSLPIYYFMSGDENIGESMKDYGEHLLRSQRPSQPYFPLPTTPYFRAWSRKYRNIALAYEFSCETTGCIEDYEALLLDSTTFLLDSRDNPSNMAVRGRNLDRGYIYWDSTVSPQYGYRIIHSLFHPQIHFEAVWQARRIITELGLNYPRLPDVDDYLLGLARFYFDEMYTEYNGGKNLNEYGFHYDYPLDQVYTPTANITIPYDSSRAAIYAYQHTGDERYLTIGNKLILGITEYATSRSPSELQDQALMFAALSRPATWHSLPFTTIRDQNGTYQLTWKAPEKAISYEVRYSEKPIVDWLGFNRATRTFEYDPQTYRAAFSAARISSVPAPAPKGTVQTMIIPGLEANRQWYFSLKYLAPGNVLPPIQKPNRLSIIGR